jgi:threonine synthase
VKYISTRGQAPSLDFEGILLAGLASDGGLYLPESWPQLAPDDIAGLAGLPYAEAALRIMRPYLAGSASERDLEEVIGQAYASFDHPDVTPHRQIGDDLWLLELFHGPTLSFKDVAMQVVARLIDRALLRKGKRATVVVATSGDTGGAAVEAFRGLRSVNLFVLHPKGRISDVQRRQMTTAPAANVHNIAVEGTFDDTQNLVKALFSDLALRDRLSLSGVNSINFTRVVAQMVYYFTAAVKLGAPARELAFTVPTGNFGDIFAGYAAARMGLPVKRLVIATNLNDILARTLQEGRYEPRPVVATSSPSMDIQLSSNFERLVFELAGRDAARVRSLMDTLRAHGAFNLGDGELQELRKLFAAYSVDEVETAATIRAFYEETGFLADPHTAVGLAAAKRQGNGATPMIVLSTAHAAKFPESVERATGRVPDMPERLREKLGQEERYQVLPNEFAAISEFICANADARAEAGA